jgi:hypothetical protein
MHTVNPVYPNLNDEFGAECNKLKLAFRYAISLLLINCHDGFGLPEKHLR